MKRLLLLIPLFLSTFAAAEEKLHPLLDEIWAFQMQQNPMWATRMGMREADSKMPDLSAASLEAAATKNTEFMTRLEAIDAASLSRTDAITLQVQKLQLQNNVDSYRYNSHFVPFTSESGFYSSLGFLPSSHKFASLDDFQNYLMRLAQFPEYFDQQISWMEKGLASGMTQPKEVLEPLPSLVAGFIFDDPKASSFYRPFNIDKPDYLSSQQWQTLQSQAADTIANAVIASYVKLKAFFVEQYIPKAKTTLGADSWPNGKAYYQNRAAYYTTTDMTVDEIHELGLSEVKRIRGEMKQVMQELEYKGTHAEFIHFLRTDPQFYAKTEQEIMRYAAYLSKKIDGKLPKLFSYLPRTPYGVEPVPASIAPNYTTGRYISPNNDTEPGYYWVNTYALDKRPLYALPALTLHEAVPGHHLQIALSRELEDLPNVRRFTYISAFGEGWGLYSEYLGKEVDFYETPYDEFGRLSYEMWRATRLVVDTGIHIKGWSRKQAVDYMLENTALSEHNVRTEVDRYITWPAQALSYKIGELTIKRLRKKAEDALGDKFDLRAFHKAVLEHGSVPLQVLENNINIFIKNAAITNG
ncbi:MAG: DUF885 family protein [Alteromonadaceae bacterium]|nr:DUF885 family protein [Alteromonadaceae bacterium]